MTVRIKKTFLPRRKVFLLAILLAFAPAAALADDAVDIGEVHVTGARDFESKEDISAFTTVIRPSDYEARTKTVEEVLQETAGVDVTSLGGEGQLSTVSIRGSSAEQVAVFIDGVRINTALFGTVDFSTIPMDSIDRIEVIRGTSSAEFGTDAIGGTINIVTKSAGKKRAIDLKLTGGSFQTLKTSESWSEPRGDFDFTLSHNHRSTAGDFTFKSARVNLMNAPLGVSKTYTRLHNRSITEDVLAKADFKLADDIRLSLTNDFTWLDRQVPGAEIETTVLYPANPLQADEQLFRDAVSAKLSVDELFIPSLSLEAGASYAMDHDHFTDPTPAIGNPIDVTFLSQEPVGYLKLQNAATFKGISSLTTLRYQYTYDRASDSSPGGAATMGTHVRHTNALFVEESIGFLNDRLMFIPKARIEHATSRKTEPSLGIGGIAKPLPWLDIKANVESSFRYPTFSELYWPDQGYLRGNPNLKDEKALGFDVGVVVHPKYVSLQLSYFQNRIDNQIIYVPVSATTIEPVNTNRVFARGIEAQVTIDPIKEIHVDANYTWLDAHYKGTSRKLPGRPPHKFVVRVEGRIKPVTIFVDTTYVSSFPANEANTVTISGHTSIDGGLTYAFAKHLYGTFEVKDITNVQMYDARAYPLPRRSYWATLGAKI